MIAIDYLLENSNLPGPRGNLELMYGFAREADAASVRACLGYIRDDTANSPEEFVGMCGIVGYATLNRGNTVGALAFLRPYASHASWRIREAVAMGIQEISAGRLAETLDALAPWVAGNSYERRAAVAGLCEPKLLGEAKLTERVLAVLGTITGGFGHDAKLSDGDDSLRKALAYGWSVAIVHAPEAGKKSFEKLFALPGKHVKWIMKENLKKNRLVRMDPDWVASCLARLA